MTKKYKKSDLDVHTYGRGRNKKFIMYTDFEKNDGPKWNTRVYPDIEGNKDKAVKQALRWLNIEGIKVFAISSGHINNVPSKISIAYKGPTLFFETDEKGFDLETNAKIY